MAEEKLNTKRLLIAIAIVFTTAIIIGSTAYWTTSNYYKAKKSKVSTENVEKKAIEEKTTEQSNRFNNSEQGAKAFCENLFQRVEGDSLDANITEYDSGFAACRWSYTLADGFGAPGQIFLKFEQIHGWDIASSTQAVNDDLQKELIEDGFPASWFPELPQQ